MDFLLNILSHWESALAVLLVLGGLIFFHELGHFAVARLFRIGVRTFSLGFGPKLLKLRRGKTDYCLSLIPLGGYVALAGEEDEAEQPDPKGKEIDGVLFAPEELYSGRPAWHRLLVVLAGPVANFVLALIIYCGIAWAQGQTYLLPEVGDVTPGTPAATAGIQPGDRVLSIDGKPIENWNAVAEGIGAGNGKCNHRAVARRFGSHVEPHPRSQDPRQYLRRGKTRVAHRHPGLHRDRAPAPRPR